MKILGVEEISRLKEKLRLRLQSLSSTPREERALIREFDDEKYRPLMEAYEAWEGTEGGKIRKRLSMTGQNPSENLIFWNGENFCQSGLGAYYEAEEETMIRAFQKMNLGADCVVEAGSGWGRILLMLLERGIFKRGLGMDISEQGCDLGARLARRIFVSAKFPCGNFLKCSLGSLAQEDYILLTHHAYYYLESEGFLDSLLRDPFFQGAVHFEPLAEDDFLDRSWREMKRQYMEKNYYINPLGQQLRDLEKKRKIEIILHQKNFWGVNPVFPHSLIAWRPKIA